MPFSMRQIARRLLALAICTTGLGCALVAQPAAAQPDPAAFSVVAQWQVAPPPLPYPGPDRTAEYRVAKDGSVTRRNISIPLAQLSDEIERLRKDGETVTFLSGKQGLKAGDFMKRYAAFQERLAGRLWFGGLEEFADFPTTSGTRLDKETLVRLGKINDFRHFAYVRSDARNRCNIYLNTRPVDRMELLRSGMTLAQFIDDEGELDSYTLTLFVDPHADHRCLGGTIYNLQYAGFTSFSVKLVEYTGKHR